MKTILLSYIATVVPMLAFDGIWLTLMAKRFYGHYLNHLMAATPQFLPAGVFYCLYALGVSVLVVTPAVQQNAALSKVFLFGALFGLVAYATYDLTNQATLRDWPTIITVVDLLWGTVLTGTVSVIAVYLTKYFV